ncbi:MAG: hypothetical protein ABIO48_14540 [Pedococcus sp.]
MPTTRVLYRRRFLNRPRHHLGAHVIAEVEIQRDSSSRPYVSADLHVSDCSRHITLDFSAETRAEATNALRKVAILRTVLADLEVALVAAVEEAGLRPQDRRH